MTGTPDTIVAPATPPGIGGVGIVRISGPLAEPIAERMLGSVPKPRVAAYRTFVDTEGRQIDSGVALYFPAPASFTGEPVLELQGHGGPVVIAMLVEAAIGCGARLAEPGEFTQRAFLNDKLDLAQAEAVADLISSGTQQAARAALRSLSGVFSLSINQLDEQLVGLRVHVEAAIDFPEEEIDFLSDADLQEKIEGCAVTLAELLTRANSGRVLRDGFRVVLVGKPNAGKSSLMNHLSGEETAIVTEVAGTTRDVLREQINIDGLAVELVDTAGLRENPDRVEEEGIRRARQAINTADAVLWIQDATDTLPTVIDGPVPEGVPVTVVRNKVDLTGEQAGEDPEDHDVIRLSAKSGAGIDDLRARLRELAGYTDYGENTFTARRRHLEAMQRAADHFMAGRQALSEARAGEIFAEELRLAHQALGEITGATSSDELLGMIFTDFCIGK